MEFAIVESSKKIEDETISTLGGKLSDKQQELLFLGLLTATMGELDCFLNISSFPPIIPLKELQNSESVKKRAIKLDKQQLVEVKSFTTKVYEEFKRQFPNDMYDRKNYSIIYLVLKRRDSFERTDA